MLGRDTDPLYRPLGAGGVTPSRRRSPRWLVWSGVALLLLGGGGVLAWGVRRSPDHRDVAAATSTIAVAPPAPTAAPPPSPPPAQVVAAASPPPSPAGDTVEIQNGVKIIRFNPAASASPITIPVEGGPPLALAPAPDPRVSETTPEGVLPRRAADGTRPADVYARPATPAAGPLVTLLMTGLGRNQTATAVASRDIAAEVDFALAPDVADAGAQAREARAAGHEIVLDLSQTDAPRADGTTADPLAHRMAKLAGYVGVLLDSGAPDETAKQMADRGLLSMTASASGTSTAPDIVVDAAGGDGAVTAALQRLAATARAKGTAIGLITNADAARGSLVQSVAALRAQNVTLEPLTTLLARRAASTAAR